MASLSSLTDAYPQQDAALPVEQPYAANAVTAGRPIVEITPSRPEPMPENVGTVSKVINRLIGANGEERYQLWPEKVVREALAAPHDAITGAMPQYAVDPVTGDVHTSPQMIEGAQAVSALAGSGGLAGTTDATLGATPFLRPALKYGDKIYKAPVNGQHLDALPAHLAEDFQTKALAGEDIDHYNFGFMNHKGQFLDREKALDYAVKEGLVDPSAGQYGALTSTLLADSSKPGTAIEAMAKTGKLTREQLERMDIDDLDKAAWGHKQDDMVTLHPKDIKIKYKDDLVNPQDKFDKGGMDWVNSVDRSEPVELGIGQDGKIHLENGHHRWFAAKKLNQPITGQITKIEGKPIEKLLKDGPFLKSDNEAGLGLAAIKEPFYSALEHNVNQISQSKMTGDQWLGTLANKPGVKPEEMDWTGVKDYLKERGNQPVTKAELQEHLQNNKVELKEVNKGNGVEKSAHDDLEKSIGNSAVVNGEKLYPDEIISGIYNGDFKPSDLPTHLQDKAQALLDAKAARNDNTKYHSYQLPGGENYREMLMTLPSKTGDLKVIKNSDGFFNIVNGKGEIQKLGSSNGTFGSEATARQILASDKNVGTHYRSSHWDEPNILAHVRMNDRVIDGKKSLHLEEIQSDWHQQGREKGYRPEQEKQMADLVKQRDEMQKEAAALSSSDARYKEIYKELPTLQTKINEIASGGVGVPNAPFKKTWHELALKRMIREAAEKGYDRLSWTPGEAQAARYDLSKTFDRLEYEPKTKEFKAYDTKGILAARNNLNPDELANYIGKEGAKKLLETEQNGAGVHKLYNADLKVGGEGMKGFYDQIIPKALSKISGEKVKTAEWPGELSNKMGEPPKMHKAHYIDIPQALKDKAMSKGFPLFSNGYIYTPVAGDPFNQKKKSK